MIKIENEQIVEFLGDKEELRLDYDNLIKESRKKVFNDGDYFETHHIKMYGWNR